VDKNRKPLLVVISGCSGVGKDALINRMKELGLPYYFPVTATSRPQRPGERDGIDYHFISKAQFEAMIKHKEFFEWASVYGNFYGLPRKAVKQAMAEGKDAIVKVDVQGAASIKRIEPDAVTVFVAAPSMEELKRRLIQRKTETGIDLEIRLKTAEKEMETMSSFDHVVTSQTNAIDQAIDEINRIIAAEKAHNQPRSHKQYYRFFTDYFVFNKRVFKLFDAHAVERLTRQMHLGDVVFRIHPRHHHHRGRVRRWIRRLLRRFRRKSR